MQPASDLESGQHAASKGRILAWASWDWGSAAFNAVMTTFVFTVYLTSSAFGGEDQASAVLGGALTVAGLAIATFTDFSVLYPDDPRVPQAQEHIASLRTEQARGAMIVARFYEKKKMWDGALVYYNEVLLRDPNSKYADEAKLRIEEIRKRTAPQTAAVSSN